MNKLISLFIFAAFASTNAISQDCIIYIPGDTGTELHYQMTNAKGKLQDSYTQKLYP